MTRLAFGTICTLISLASPAFAQTTSPGVFAEVEAEIAHGGGCRKSSPPGKCCHAGSKPYHCH